MTFSVYAFKSKRYLVIVASQVTHIEEEENSVAIHLKNGEVLFTHESVEAVTGRLQAALQPEVKKAVQEAL